jgi:hypothetical protein
MMENNSVCLLESSANQTLGVEDGVFGVHGSLIFCSITD